VVTIIELLLQVTLQTWFFLSYLMDSLAIAANGLVADGLGRGQVSTARAAALRCSLYGGGVSLALLALLGAFPQGVSAIFTDSRCGAACCSCGCGVVTSQRDRSLKASPHSLLFGFPAVVLLQ
jgi:Na+-driven multidrug efflux pump